MDIVLENPKKIETIIAKIPMNNLIILSILPTFLDNIFTSEKKVVNF